MQISRIGLDIYRSSRWGSSEWITLEDGQTLSLRSMDISTNKQANKKEEKRWRDLNKLWDRPIHLQADFIFDQSELLLLMSFLFLLGGIMRTQKLKTHLLSWVPTKCLFIYSFIFAGVLRLFYLAFLLKRFFFFTCLGFAPPGFCRKTTAFWSQSFSPTWTTSSFQWYMPWCNPLWLTGLKAPTN